MWLDSLAAHLQANSVGTVATDIWINEMPETDDDGPTVGLAILPGETTILGGNRIIDYPHLILGVRGASYTTAFLKIVAAREVLRAITNQTVQGTAFLGVEAEGPIEDAGRDARSRQQYRATFRVVLG